MGHLVVLMCTLLQSKIATEDKSIYIYIQLVHYDPVREIWGVEVIWCKKT